MSRLASGDVSTRFGGCLDSTRSREEPAERARATSGVGSLRPPGAALVRRALARRGPGAAFASTASRPRNGSDQVPQGNQAGRGLADLRGELDDPVHAGAEHRERGPTGKRGRRCEEATEPGTLGGLGERAAGRVVVAHQVLVVDTERGGDVSGGEVQHLEARHRDLPDAPAHLEGVDLRVEDVAEELRPGRLLLARRVPDARAAASVVAAVGDGGVRDGEEPVAGRSLVPELPVDPPRSEAGDEGSKRVAQT